MNFHIFIPMCRLTGMIVAMLVVGGTSSSAMAQLAARPIDQLIFKGTHNSYACKTDCSIVTCTNDPPIMNHPPNIQIDDFGVWAVELDFSVIRENGIPTAFVGHDGPGDAVTCFGREFPRWPPSARLTDFLRVIRSTLALSYRPVFIYFDIKHWGDADASFADEFKLSLGIAAVNEVFQENFIVLADYLAQHGNQYPVVPEVAGKAIVYFPNETLRGTNADHCTSRQTVENSIRTGTPLEDGGAKCGPEGCRVLRLDQYQADWTFEYGVPPNPLIVDRTAASQWTVMDSDGDFWFCLNGDVWRGQVVHQQGTYRFPYGSVAQAVARAEGTTPNGVRDTLRAGYGWTVLIKPGNYPETLTINIPLTLKEFDGSSGVVVIGRRDSVPAGQDGFLHQWRLRRRQHDELMVDQQRWWW